MLSASYYVMKTGTPSYGQAYVAHLIYRILCDGISTEQYEEQWRLIFAENDLEALELARETGQEEASEFADRWGRRISWQMIAVKDLQRTDLSHGTLVHSQIREVPLITAPVWVCEPESSNSSTSNYRIG